MMGSNRLRYPDPYGLYDMQFPDAFVASVYGQERSRAIYRAFLSLRASGCKNPHATLAEGLGVSRSRAGQLIRKGERLYEIMAAGRKSPLEGYIAFSITD